MKTMLMIFMTMSLIIVSNSLFTSATVWASGSESNGGGVSAEEEDEDEDSDESASRRKRSKKKRKAKAKTVLDDDEFHNSETE